MPTKKKRVGFIPRADVMKIIDNLSIENNLSYSKIISILVEEALSIRGIFNKRTGKSSTSYKHIKDDSQDIIEETYDLKDNDKFIINTKLGNHKNFQEISLLKELNQEQFDLKTYKMFISFLKFQEMMSDFNSL